MGSEQQRVLGGACKAAGAGWTELAAAETLGSSLYLSKQGPGGQHRRPLAQQQNNISPLWSHNLVLVSFDLAKSLDSAR